MVPLIVLAVALAMMLVERVFPGRDFPKVPGWWTRALMLNGAQAASVYLAAFTYDRWLGAFHVFETERVGWVPAIVIGYVVHTFVYYWWHRARHDVDFLWRWVHQVHHSPQRIEIITSFYKHPIEILVNGILSSVVLVLLLGLGPEAAAYTMLVNGLAELFYHWNVKTPHFVGYLFQRPESHCVHHQEGLHAKNYGDLPIFDMVFGTFHNPRVFEDRCGFGPEAEHRLAEMLAGKDVSS